ncbi:MAG TPA: cobyrinic acid a,c-diamide synthase, partial [Candidatus Dormibacteraeota bacterium]|nr:cobyrinic acid a,c-diamide synthase [Candidatus Dormibacteraeota bacterium]
MARRRPLVVTALASGSGKTVLTLGLAAALRRRDLAVQPFKVGPDYLDPAWLSMAAGRPALNLDTHLMGELGVRASVARALADDPIALVEGVLGLCDGRLGSDGDASTAAVARLIGARLLVVVDIAGTARTAA